MPLVGRKPETAAEPARFFGYNARSAYPKNNQTAEGCLIEGPATKAVGVWGREPPTKMPPTKKVPGRGRSIPPPNR
jgi:hypothetical protein